MFDVGFSELLLVALVALVVLGPERLPGAARTAGLWIGRLKRSFAAIKSEVEREIGADEIRLQLHNEQILERERLQQAAQPGSPPASGAAGTAPAPFGEAPAAAAPTAEQANAPIAANSRLASLPEYQATSPAVPAAEAAATTNPAAAHASPSPAPSEPPRPT